MQLEKLAKQAPAKFAAPLDNLYEADDDLDTLTPRQQATKELAQKRQSIASSLAPKEMMAAAAEAAIPPKGVLRPTARARVGSVRLHRAAFGRTGLTLPATLL